MIKSLLFTAALLIGCSVALTAQSDSTFPTQFKNRWYWNPHHIMLSFGEPKILVGWERQLKGPHRLLLEATYIYQPFGLFGGHGYRLRTGYRYYWPRTDMQRLKRYATLMVAWGQGFEPESGWYCRNNCEYREYLAGMRIREDVKINLGTSWLHLGKKRRHYEVLIAPGFRLLRFRSPTLPSNLSPDVDDASFWDRLFNSNKLYILPDFTFQINVGRVW